MELLRVLEEGSDEIQPLVSERWFNAKDGFDQEGNRGRATSRKAVAVVQVKDGTRTSNKNLGSPLCPLSILRSLYFNLHNVCLLQIPHFIAEETEAQKG